MGSLEVFARCIAALICSVGGVLTLSGLIDFANMHGAQKIVGTVVDYTQEYSSRGFLWKARVSYTFNGNECFYITRARTTRRGSTTIALYINEKGRIYEKTHAIEKTILGSVILLGTLIMTLIVMF
jgi:hypothetical protein